MLSRPSQGVCRRACYLSVLCCLVLSVESACVRAVPGLDPDQIQDAAHAECRYACRVQVYYKYACFSLCVCLCKQDANTHADLVIIFAEGRGFGASLVFSGLSGLAFACFPAGFCRFLSRVCVVRVCAMAGQIHESMSSAPALPLRLWGRVELPAHVCAMAGQINESMSGGPAICPPQTAKCKNTKCYANYTSPFAGLQI